MPSLKTVLNVLKILPDPKERFLWLSYHGFYNNVSDEEYLKRKYKVILGKELNLENPTTFCEKINWMKLYDRRPLYTLLADKYLVKQYVAERIGSDHVLPVLGVWERFEDINFDLLPNEFVLKCTHDSGGQVIVKDKARLNKLAAKKKINACLKRNYFYNGREWAYKDIKPRIIAEPFIDSLGKSDSVEYKLTCFDGNAKLITICKGIAHTSLEQRTNAHFDRNLNKLDFYAYYKNPVEPAVIPPQIQDIIKYAEILSKGIPQVRVDFYLHNGTVYFGEMTFYTWDGFIIFNPPEMDLTMGEWFKLPPKTTT